MSVKEILREIESLPSEERWQVLDRIRRLVEPASARADGSPEPLRIQSLKGHRVLTPVISHAEDEAAEWARFSAQNLARAYGDDEPEYTEADLR